MTNLDSMTATTGTVTGVVTGSATCVPSVTAQPAQPCPTCGVCPTCGKTKLYAWPAMPYIQPCQGWQPYTVWCQA